MKCALITAGGCGTRLYPLSTKDCPKQFVRMFGDKSLLQLTYERLSKYFDKDNIFIVLPLKYKHFINELLPFVKDENIIIEPSQKSTAPAILYSLLKIKNLRKDASLFVFPADHYIPDENKFINCIDDAYSFIQENDSLVLFGIKPTAPLNRYGYLKAKDAKYISKISKFKEKPNNIKAKIYFANSKYYWSSDIYGFKINYMLDLYKKYMPSDYALLTNNLLDVDSAYELCTATSTACGIFEKADNVYMMKCDFLWDDVGVFESLLKYTDNKNVIDSYNEKIMIDALKRIENVVNDN